MGELRERIGQAWAARSVLHQDSQTTAYRLFHGYHEGRQGLEIDRYGDVAIIASRVTPAEEREQVAEALLSLHDFSCIVDKPRQGEVRALHGRLDKEPSVVLEGGLRYGVEVWAPRNPGLYLDARPARSWLRQHSEGRHVLNLFCYAGSLGVAAMAGGARSLTHVDTQKRALARCKWNHQLNDQRIDSRDLVRSDVAKYLQGLVRAGSAAREFGGVIIDAPPLPSGADADAPGLSPVGLAKACAAVTEVGAWILVFFHHDPRSWDALESAFQAASGCELQPIWRSQSGIDFPESSESSDLRLSAFRRER